MAAQGQLDTVTASADGRSGTVTLYPGKNLLVVESALIAAATTAILQTRLGSDGQWEEHKDPDDATLIAQLNVDNQATKGSSPKWAKSFVLEGPGEACVFVSDYSGSSAITLKVISTEKR